MTEPTPSLWALVDARDASIAALARVRAAEHATLVVKEDELQAMGAQLEEKESSLEEKEADLLRLSAELKGKETGLVQLEVQLKEKESQLHRMGAQLEDKENQLHRMGVQLKDKEAELRRAGVQVSDKEKAILKLVADLEAKEAALQRENQAVQRAERERAFLQRLVDQGQKVTGGGGEAAVDINARLLKDLEDKEKVLRELREAVKAYRIAFAMFGWVIRPMNWTISKVVSMFAGMTPRLGVLHQHPPRKLSSPPPYWLKTPPAVAPRISIVTPSYQQGHFIERTIRSVLDQGYPNLEYHVQDGASTDTTREVLQRFDGKITWTSERDSGQTQAINRGFARTPTGEVMAWLNSDDILLPGALAYVADFFASHPEVDVIYGHRLLIDENEKEIGRWMVPAHNDRVLSWADYVPQETLFWRRPLWDKVGGVDESFRFAMDWDLIVRFRDAGARFVRVPRFLGGFRIHPQQKTSAAISDVGFQEMTRIRERELGRVPTHREIGKAVFPYLLRHMFVDLHWRIRSAFGART